MRPELAGLLAFVAKEVIHQAAHAGNHLLLAPECPSVVEPTCCPGQYLDPSKWATVEETLLDRAAAGATEQSRAHLILSAGAGFVAGGAVAGVGVAVCLLCPRRSYGGPPRRGRWGLGRAYDLVSSSTCGTSESRWRTRGWRSGP